jgi:hypothetical protein
MMCERRGEAFDKSSGIILPPWCGLHVSRYLPVFVATQIKYRSGSYPNLIFASRIEGALPEMTHIPLPHSRPNNQRIARIEQIEYDIRRSPDTPIVTIYASNNRCDGKPYQWCNMPASYDDALHRILYKLELLKIVARSRAIDRIHTASVLKYLAHVDKTLDSIWEEAWKAQAEDPSMMGWRSDTLDRWLFIECHVQR